MTEGQLALRLVARHGIAVERLSHEMLTEAHDQRVPFLAYDAANFIYAFLLAQGSSFSLTDRALRDSLYEALLAVLAEHGITWQSLTALPGGSPADSTKHGMGVSLFHKVKAHQCRNQHEQ